MSKFTFTATARVRERYDAEVEFPVYRQYQRYPNHIEHASADIYECMTETHTVTVIAKKSAFDGPTFEIKTSFHDGLELVFENGPEFALGQAQYSLAAHVFHEQLLAAKQHVEGLLK